MRKYMISFVAIAMVSGPVIAHPEYDDELPRPAERKPMAQLAQDAVIRLVTQSKLPTSWGSAKAVKSEPQMIDGTQRWVVSMENSAIKSAKKRMLYVILDRSGNYVSASHSPR